MREKQIISLIMFFCFPLFAICVKAQPAPPIGIIDFYGLKTLTEAQVRAALQIKEGDNLPASRAEVEKRLTALLPNVEQVQLNSVCCEAGKIILYVGIKEKGTPALRYRPAPRGAIRLPDEMVKTAEAFYDALQKATLKGDVEEDDSEGHALMKNAEGRALQKKFIPFANQNLSLLHRVLHESSDARHRTLAAQIMAYYKDKKVIIKDLVYGVKDADAGVRNASTRALGVLAGFARNNPEKNLKVPVAPFVDMLNSFEWTDRNKSSIVLWELTEKRDPAILAELKQKALDSLIDIARWKSPGHAMPAFVILARIAGVPDNEIIGMWEDGNRREELIKKVKSK